jgi:hypothetical protein
MLRVFENMVLRRMFGLTRDDVTGEWKRLYNKNFMLSTHQISFGLSNQEV